MKTPLGAASFLGMMLALTPAMASVPLVDEPPVLPQPKMAPADMDANPSLPFESDANLLEASLYDAISLERLVTSDLIGSHHDLKVVFWQDAVRIEVPGHRIRLDTLLGYDPEVDDERPYQTEFDPNVRYRLDRGGFKVWGDGLGQCGDVRAIYASGSSLYFDMPEDGEGAQCAIDALLKGYQLFAFHQEDRPEVYEIKKLKESNTQDKVIYGEDIQTSGW